MEIYNAKCESSKVFIKQENKWYESSDCQHVTDLLADSVGFALVGESISVYLPKGQMNGLNSLMSATGDFADAITQAAPATTQNGIPIITQTDLSTASQNLKTAIEKIEVE